jgi:hypothetical protein
VAVVEYLQETWRTVEPMLRLVQEHKLEDGGPGSREGRRFIEDRLLAGGEMLGALWLTAWRQAAPDSALRAVLLQRRAVPPGSH